MTLLYHWQRRNYDADIRSLGDPQSLTLEQNSPAMGSATVGERLWAFTRRRDGQYALAAQLVTGAVQEVSSPIYGRHRVLPIPGSVVLYNTFAGPDVEPAIRSLSIATRSTVLGQSFQGPAAVRRISPEDDGLITEFAERVPLLETPGSAELETEDAWWEDLRAAAEAFAEAGDEFPSPVQGRRYRITAVEPRRIVIQRLGRRGADVLTQERTARAVRAVIDAGGRVPRGTLCYTVAKESTLVRFHPALEWDETHEWIVFRQRAFSPSGPGLPGELSDGVEYSEGAVRQVLVNAFERDYRARERCLAEKGRRCAVCRIDFGETYGSTANGFIHVHHLRPLSEIRASYSVDPVQDLVPVCPNCHAVIHLRTPPFSIDDVIEMFRD